MMATKNGCLRQNKKISPTGSSTWAIARTGEAMNFAKEEKTEGKYDLQGLENVAALVGAGIHH